MASLLRIAGVAFLTFLLTYPVAALVQHGLDPTFWPPGVIMPGDWFGAIATGQLRLPSGAYWDALIGRSDAFANGGWTYTTMLMLVPLLITVVAPFLPSPLTLKRDVSGVFGDARFANAAERGTMREGLELGIDPQTGHAVRLAVQGTLATIAPPRKGKTSGLLIPNLAYPEPQSWSGPAVVLDPKGEVFRAVAERRAALGRRVVCLDPLGLVNGKDRWNPLATRDPADILYLQHTALALLPEASGGDEASAYFRNRAVDLITGAMLVALTHDKRSVAAVQELLGREEILITHLKALGRQPAAVAALEILQADPKTKDPVKSTALQAFQWLADARLRQLVGASTFDLAELSTGAIDLFVAVPPEYKRVLAPLLRWLLSDLFTAVRRNRPEQRIMVFIDEAAALGRFDEILTAAGELPGYGASLWTLWQDRGQIVGLYGEAGADVLLNTAEVVTVFDVPAVDPDESERWSRAIGQYTASVETLNRPTEGKGTSSFGPQGAPLMSKEALVTMSSSDLLVFPNSGGHARHPIRLRKTVAHTDPRFRRLITPVAPVGRAR
jgi:type IV secretion system protein VirD4